MLSLRIALRYLFSRKSHGAVNVISAISLAGVAVATAAMIIVLSVFNGFTRLAESKLSKFDPDFLVVASEGKSIAGADSLAAALVSDPRIASASAGITEQAFAVAGQEQMPVTIKGFSPATLEASGLYDITIDGICSVADSYPYPTAMMSVGTAMGLSARPADHVPVVIFEPKREGRINPANPMSSFRSDTVMPMGVYQVEQEEYDRDIIIIPLERARRLLNYSDEATELAVYLADGVDAAEGRKAIEDRLPNEGFVVKDRLQQQEQALRMIAVEKWISFLMLVFILVIASFNIISSLSMLIIEKEGNMAVMRAMGASDRLIKSIFMAQGWLITVCGGVIGIVLGSLLVLGQRHFGWIKLSASDPSLMAINVYPVELAWGDILTVLLSLVFVAFAIAFLTRFLMKKGAMA